MLRLGESLRNLCRSRRTRLGLGLSEQLRGCGPNNVEEQEEKGDQACLCRAALPLKGGNSRTYSKLQQAPTRHGKAASAGASPSAGKTRPRKILGSAEIKSGGSGNWRALSFCKCLFSSLALLPVVSLSWFAKESSKHAVANCPPPPRTSNTRNIRAS